MSRDFLGRWLEDVLSTPGLTGLDDPGEARRALLEDALRAVSLVEATPGAVVDVGSGGGSPGIPLAVDASRPRLHIARRRAAQVSSS